MGLYIDKVFQIYQDIINVTLLFMIDPSMKWMKNLSKGEKLIYKLK